MDVGSGSDLGSGNATLVECNELPEFGFALGIIMGVFGSIGINVGQNLQAAGIQSLPEPMRVKPHKSRQWVIGLSIFIGFSLLNFAALALAPASILTPLESIQFVTNIVYNRFVNDAVVSRKMVGGVGLALVGTLLSVVFGASGGGCHSLEELAGFWQGWAWWAYLSCSIVLAVSAFCVHRSYARRLAVHLEAPHESSPPPRHRIVMPVSYTIAAALAGGAQMIVHSKVISELLAMLFQGNIAIFTHWMFYVELVLVCGCGIVWVFKLTECLVFFDPLLILPLMVGTYILFGGLAGGIFFREFDTLHLGYAGYWGWALYGLGVLCVLLGLCLIAVASAEVERELERISEAEAVGVVQQSELEVALEISAAAAGVDYNGEGEGDGEGAGVPAEAVAVPASSGSAFWSTFGYSAPEPAPEKLEDVPGALVSFSTPTAKDKMRPPPVQTPLDGSCGGTFTQSSLASATPQHSSLRASRYERASPTSRHRFASPADSHGHHRHAGGLMPTPGAARRHAVFELKMSQWHESPTQGATPQPTGGWPNDRSPADWRSASRASHAPASATPLRHTIGPHGCSPAMRHTTKHLFADPVARTPGASPPRRSKTGLDQLHDWVPSILPWSGERSVSKKGSPLRNSSPGILGSQKHLPTGNGLPSSVRPVAQERGTPPPRATPNSAQASTYADSPNSRHSSPSGSTASPGAKQSNQFI